MHKSFSVIYSVLCNEKFCRKFARNFYKTKQKTITYHKIVVKLKKNLAVKLRHKYGFSIPEYLGIFHYLKT